MTERNTNPAKAAWRRPATLDELRAALTAFSGWDPVERARRAPELIEAAKTVLADERGTAMSQAKAGGVGATALARELGVTRAKVYEAISRTTGPARSGTGHGRRRDLTTEPPIDAPTTPAKGTPS